MSARKLKFAIFGNEYQPSKSASVSTLLTALRNHNAEIHIERQFFNFLTIHYGKQAGIDSVFDVLDFTVDYVIAIGGDGTFLKAASYVGDKGYPILGVNTGRLGFLADVLPSEINATISDLYANNYEAEARSVIMLETDREQLECCPYALNDISILKRDNAAMITIRASINGESLVTYQADGLLICTPTGSTAYNLSNGGPIIVPQAGIMCITPVAPHSLNVRPIALSDKNVITLEVESRSHNFLVAVDGRSEKLKEGTRLTIRRAPYDVNIVKTGSHRYFSTLREKLLWGADKR
jgi:NAD+ kinase